MKTTLLATALLGMLTLAGCQSMMSHHNQHDPLRMHAPMAKATLTHTKKATKPLMGEVHFSPERGAVLVTGKISGLVPNSTNAIHIHQVGNCGKDGDGASGHFNPFNTPHGHPTAANSHAGDLPNITADANGVATLRFLNPKISLHPDALNAVYNRAMIIHAKADDYVSQPAGNAGDRIACGVITALK